MLLDKSLRDRRKIGRVAGDCDKVVPPNPV
jgi:hypothetical protein